MSVNFNQTKPDQKPIKKNEKRLSIFWIIKYSIWKYSLRHYHYHVTTNDDYYRVFLFLFCFSFLLSILVVCVYPRQRHSRICFVFPSQSVFLFKFVCCCFFWLPKKKKFILVAIPSSSAYLNGQNSVKKKTINM